MIDMYRQVATSEPDLTAGVPGMLSAAHHTATVAALAGVLAHDSDTNDRH